jgi:hypothetical protein
MFDNSKLLTVVSDYEKVDMARKVVEARISG